MTACLDQGNATPAPAPDTAWQPSASLEILKQRTQLIQQIRHFFTARHILEVETPSLSRAATPDPALLSFQTTFEAGSEASRQALYLQTSPEFFMKRMVAAGYGAIYQIAKVFRNAESGRRHNPEFTLLEWYRPGLSLQQLMDEVEALVTELFAHCSVVVESARRVTYRQLFLDVVGIDPLTATTEDWQACLDRHHVHLAVEQRLSASAYCDLLLSHVIEPAMPAGLCFVYDYPADQASLASVRQDDPPVAERFELFYNGMELANGFHELADAVEQRQRFVAENTQRQQQGFSAVPLDERFLEALKSGLPDCSGVAMGLDRLMMVLLGCDSIDDVIAFPFAGV